MKQRNPFLRADINGALIMLNESIDHLAEYMSQVEYLHTIAADGESSMDTRLLEAQWHEEIVPQVEEWKRQMQVAVMATTHLRDRLVNLEENRVLDDSGGMKAYRKKPVVIEAMQFDGGGTNLASILEWIGDGAVTEVTALANGSLDFFIETLEGLMRVSEGDYVIKGVKEEFYSCKPDIFAETYEAEEAVSEQS